MNNRWMIAFLVLNGACSKHRATLESPSSSTAQPAGPQGPMPGAVNINVSLPTARHEGADVCFVIDGPSGWSFAGAERNQNPHGDDIAWSYIGDDGTLVFVWVFPAATRRLPPDAGDVTLIQAEAWSVAGQLGLNHAPLDPIRPLTVGHQAGAVKHGETDPSQPMHEFVPYGMVAVWQRDAWLYKIAANWSDPDRTPEQMVAMLEPFAAQSCAIRGLTGAGREPIAMPRRLPPQ